MLTPGAFVEHYATLGACKADASCRRLFPLAVLAGLFIALGCLTASTASYALGNASAARIACGLVFPFGLILVLFTGAELFTGNCLIAIPVLAQRAAPGGMLRNLVVVYLGNFAGALLAAAACVTGGLLDQSGGAFAIHAIRLAAAKCALPFHSAVTLGILCNVLVCAAVMAALCSQSLCGRAAGVFIPVFVFVLCGFEHCVANMYYIPLGLLAQAVPQYAALAQAAGLDISALSLERFFLCNLLPVTLGNLIGGCGLAALLWAVNPPSAVPQKTE